MTVKVIKNVQIALFSPPAIWTPQQYNNDGKPKYRAYFLMAPDSEAKQVVEAAIRETAAASPWASKAKEHLAAAKASGKICLVDGDTKAYAGFPGNWALTAIRDPGRDPGAPVIVDRDGKTPIKENQGRIFSGCFVNAKVGFYAQNNVHGKTVRCTLIAVQYVKDGESFGGAAPASGEGLDDLGFVEDIDDQPF